MKNTRLALAMAALLLCMPVVQSCGTTTTTTVETQTAPPTADGQEHTTTTKTTTTEQPESVLGATANAIGTIILFPFRLVGAALGLLI